MNTEGLRTMDVKRLTGQNFLYLSMPCVWRLPARKRQQRFIIGANGHVAGPPNLYYDAREAAQAAIAYSLTR